MTDAQTPAGEVPLESLRFCTIDLETTGIGTNDRIVEIAIVVADSEGTKESEVHTIVNPEVTLAELKGGGASWAHGLSDDDVVDAPTFAEIADLVRFSLGGTILTAHGAPFVVRMLEGEFERAGLGPLDPPFLCTKSLRTKVGLEGAGSKSLEWHCWQEGIPMQDGKPTLIEARVVTKLAARYIGTARANGLETLQEIKAKDTAAKSWARPLPPVLESPPVPTLKQRDGVAVEPSGLKQDGKIRAKAVSDYRKALSSALDDFQITADENRALQAVANKLALSAAEVKAAHEGHLEEMIAEQASDKVFSWAEQQQALIAASLLAVSEARVRELMAEHKASVEGEVSDASASGGLEGVSICFTGAFTAQPMTRSEVHSLAEEHGLEVKTSVTKGLDILVCQDPTAGTSKLRTAASYGTIVISQNLFLALIGSAAAGDGEVAEVLSKIEESRNS